MEFEKGSKALEIILDWSFHKTSPAYYRVLEEISSLALNTIIFKITSMEYISLKRLSWIIDEYPCVKSIIIGCIPLSMHVICKD